MGCFCKFKVWFMIYLCNWPYSQITECTSSISQNAPFRTEMCTFLFWMKHCGNGTGAFWYLWNWSIAVLCSILCKSWSHCRGWDKIMFQMMTYVCCGFSLVLAYRPAPWDRSFDVSLNLCIILVEVLACHLFSTKQLPEPMMTYSQLDP